MTVAFRCRIAALRGELLALLAARALQLGGGFAVSVLLVWLHGLAAAGTYAIAIMPAAAAGHLSGLGLASALPRQALPEGERATIGLLVTLATLPLLALLAAAYGLALGHDGRDALTIAVLAWSAAAGGQVGVQQCLLVLQGRTAWAPLTPFLQALALAAAAVFGTDLLGFALVLAGGRLLGSLAGFLPLRFARTSVAALRRSVREGSRFLPLDLLSGLSELVLVPALAATLTRAEIGLFGLARQFIVVADTPGWSFVQTRYPALVGGLERIGADVARRNERLSWLSGVATLGVAAGMALLVYRLPQLVPVLVPMLLALPARYACNFCDQALRATGRVRDCTLLGLGRLVLSLAMLPALALPFGLWGAVAATAALSLASGLLYRWRLDAHHPGLLPAARPWRFA